MLVSVPDTEWQVRPDIMQPERNAFAGVIRALRRTLKCDPGNLRAGDESPVMLDAHAEAGYAVGTPFASPGAYDFAQVGL